MTGFLSAPSNLIGLIKIAQEFEAVLKEFLPIAQPDQLGDLKQLASICAQVHEDRDEIARCFPLASVDGHSQRKTLTDYYGEHPHYCVYWHRVVEPADLPHYRALLASLMPVLKKLDRQRQTEPSPFAQWADSLGRSVRQLTVATGKEQLIMRELPVRAQTPSELRCQLQDLYRQYRIDPRPTNDYHRFAHISRMLAWFDDDEVRTGRGFGKRSPVAKRATPKHGAIETRHTDKRVSLDMPIGDGAPTRLSAYFERPDDATLDEEAFDHDQEFDNAPMAVTVQWQPRPDGKRILHYGLANRRRVATSNARYFAQAIEQSNQHLPVGRSVLSGYELTKFFDAIENLQLDVWAGISPKLRAAVAAWAACRFYLGREESSIKSMALAGDTSVTPADIVWYPQTRAFMLQASPPRHAEPAAAVVATTVATCSAFQLRAPETLCHAMNRLDMRAGVPFGRSFEAAYDELIRAINARHSVQLTRKRLSDTLPGLINQLAPADRVFGHYFLGRPPNQHNPAVYSVVPARTLQSLFDAACTIIDRRIRREPAHSAVAPLPGMISDADDHVGSRHVPTKDAVRQTVSALGKRVASLASLPLRRIQEAHNAYTAYVVFFLLGTTGIRAVSTLLPAGFDVDEETGMTFVSDKDTVRYRNARIVLLNPAMIEQLGFYREHVTRLRQHLALINASGIDRLDARTSLESMTSHLKPKRDVDADRLAVAAPELFMLDEQTARIQPVSPSLLTRHVGPSWELRLAALRHFVRSDLLRRGLSGEAINALLGHGDRGEAPWGEFSTLPPAVWKRQIAVVLAQLLESLGMRALPSPLLGRVAGQ